MKNKQVQEVNDLIVQETKEQTIADGLSEIYHDEDGKMIDVKKLIIKKKKGLIFWSISVAIIITCLSLAYFGLKHLMKQGINTDAVDFNISLDKQPIAGEEFFVLVDYQNNNQLAINNVQIHLTYPDDLIYVDSLPVADSDHNTWQIGMLPAGARGQLKIKVKIITEPGKSSLISGELRYNPEGFSSEFKKVANTNVSISDTGLDISIINSDSILVGEKQKIVIRYRARQKFLDNYRLVIEPANPNNLEFIADVQKNQNIELIKPWVWQVTNISDQEQELVIYYKLIDQVASKQFFDFKFSYRLSAPYVGPEVMASSSTSSLQMQNLVGEHTTSSSVEISRPPESFYYFKNQTLELEVVKNSLNLLLLINGSDKDQSVDFGQTLNYSLSYNNKGETPLEDLSFTVVIDSDLVDWTSLKDRNHGLAKNNTISWSKDQIKDLGTLAKGSSGSIDFSVRLKEAGSEVKTDQIKSYAQFKVGSSNDLESLIKIIKERESSVESPNATSSPAILAESNQSNIITNRVNSDFQVEQKILYFNEDNIPVGAGPLPLEVDKDTSLRVFWKIKNSFHDLETVKVAVKLPEYAKWQEKSSLSGGSIRFDETSKQVIWELQNLSKAMGEATAEFSLNFKPTTSQRNQIIILLPMCEATATDVLTKSGIRRTSKVKTSKLEDDTIVRTVNLDAASGLIK